MWSEFNAHFRNKDRATVKVNHHDFLDGGFLGKLKDNASRRFFSQVGRESLDKPPGSANTSRTSHVDLGRHRIAQTRKQYQKLAVNILEVNKPKELPRWL